MQTSNIAPVELGMDILKPFFPTFDRVMLEALEETNRAMGTISVPVNKRSRCSLLHNIAYEKIKQALSGHPDIRIIEKYESIQIIFSKKLIGRIKKLNKNNFSANNPTNRNNNIISQQLSLFPDSELTHIDLGYKIDPTWVQYDNLVVVCRLNDSIKWFISYRNNDIITTQAEETEPILIQETDQVIIKKQK
jgi:hypothetical protein